jgi:DNA-binding transcriptional regulator LsrR (DeoR family)
METKLLTKKEFSEKLGITTAQLSRLVREGRVNVALYVTRKTMYFEPIEFQTLKDNK